jgi:UDP-N-acetylmuramoylalanine--D-glutamate ligase
LKESGLDVGLAGNVGHSLARQVAENDRAYFVVELTSFQLDGMFDSKIDIAILLNITPDHLDRYENDFSKYVDSKFRIIQNMQPQDHFIYNEDDPHIASRVYDINSPAQKEPISVSNSETAIAYLQDKSLILKYGTSNRKIASDALPIRGKHNMINAMAAVRAAMALEVDWPSISKALNTFRNIPHRLEYSGSIRGVDFYNDSKATNVDAVWYALDSFDKPVVLIIGGKDKGNDYSKLDGLVRQKVKSIVALGIDNSKIESHFSRLTTDIVSTDSMFRAVEMAFSKAEEKDVVLLSPACASFDLFKNYEERGEKFKEAVVALKTNIENNLMMAI